MSEVRKYRKFRQREPLRVPSLWKGEERAFAIQLNGQLDTVYADMGRIQQSAETIPTADQIQRTGENPQTVEETLEMVDNGFSAVNITDSTIETDGDRQIYIGDTTLEKYINDNNVYQQYFLWNDTTITQAQFIAKCDSMMDRPGLYFLGYINNNVATRIGFTINGYVIGRYHNANFKHIEVISSATDSHAGQRELLVKVSSGGWYSEVFGTPNNNDIFSKPGNTISGTYYGHGHLTSSKTRMRLIFSMPKRLDKVTPVLLTGSRFTVRYYNGYVDEFNADNTVEIIGEDVPYTWSIYRQNGYSAIELNIIKSGGFTPVNNTVLQVMANPLKIRFD